MKLFTETRFIRRYLHFFKLPNRRREYIARKLIGFSSEQMYNVVADIKNYKEFVPFCMRSTILSEKPTEVRANLEIGFPPIYENYTSTVQLVEPTLVRAICKDGRIFNNLESTWKFSPGLKSNKNSCIVDYHISFEFKSTMYSQLAALFFDRLCREMEGAFVEEVKRRFGKESLPSHTLQIVKH